MFYFIFMDGSELNSVKESSRRIASSDALKAHQVSVLHRYTMCSHPKLTSKLINQHEISSFRTDLLKIIEKWRETNVFEWIVNDSLESIGIYEFSIYLNYKIKENTSPVDTHRIWSIKERQKIRQNLWQFRERVAYRDLINLIWREILSFLKNERGPERRMWIIRAH